MVKASRRHPAGEEDVAALMETLREQCSAEVIASLIETGEVAADEPDLVTAMLRRFLAAEKMDVHSAARRLAKHAAWRREHLPEGRVDEVSAPRTAALVCGQRTPPLDVERVPPPQARAAAAFRHAFAAFSPPQAELQGQIAQRKVLLQPAPSPGGSPLLIIRVRCHDPVPDVADVERFVIYSLEAAARLCDGPANPDGKMWALFDLRALRYHNLDRHALSSCFSILQNAFPERVRRIYMLHSPLVFDALWRIVSPFVDPTTRAKVRFLSGAGAQAALLQAVGPGVLPEEYGGAAAEVPVQEAAAAARKGQGGGGRAAVAVSRQASSVEEFLDACEQLEELAV
jgi:hypothetical protein